MPELFTALTSIVEKMENETSQLMRQAEAIQGEIRKNRKNTQKGSEIQTVLKTIICRDFLDLSEAHARVQNLAARGNAGVEYFNALSEYMALHQVAMEKPAPDKGIATTLSHSLGDPGSGFLRIYLKAVMTDGTVEFLDTADPKLLKDLRSILKPTTANKKMKKYETFKNENPAPVYKGLTAVELTTKIEQWKVREKEWEAFKALPLNEKQQLFPQHNDPKKREETFTNSPISLQKERLGLSPDEKSSTRESRLEAFKKLDENGQLIALPHAFSAAKAALDAELKAETLKSSQNFQVLSSSFFSPSTPENPSSDISLSAFLLKNDTGLETLKQYINDLKPNIQHKKVNVADEKPVAVEVEMPKAAEACQQAGNILSFFNLKNPLANNDKDVNSRLALANLSNVFQSESLMPTPEEVIKRAGELLKQDDRNHGAAMPNLIFIALASGYLSPVRDDVEINRITKLSQNLDEILEEKKQIEGKARKFGNMITAKTEELLKPLQEKIKDLRTDLKDLDEEVQDKTLPTEQKNKLKENIKSLKTEIKNESIELRNKRETTANTREIQELEKEKKEAEANQKLAIDTLKAKLIKALFSEEEVEKIEREQKEFEEEITKLQAEKNNTKKALTHEETEAIELKIAAIKIKQAKPVDQQTIEELIAMAKEKTNLSALYNVMPKMSKNISINGIAAQEAQEAQEPKDGKPAKPAKPAKDAQPSKFKINEQNSGHFSRMLTDITLQLGTDENSNPLWNRTVKEFEEDLKKLVTQNVDYSTKLSKAPTENKLTTNVEWKRKKEARDKELALSLTPAQKEELAREKGAQMAADALRPVENSPASQLSAEEEQKETADGKVLRQAQEQINATQHEAKTIQDRLKESGKNKEPLTGSVKERVEKIDVNQQAQKHAFSKVRENLHAKETASGLAMLETLLSLPALASNQGVIDFKTKTLTQLKNSTLQQAKEAEELGAAVVRQQEISIMGSKIFDIKKPVAKMIEEVLSQVKTQEEFISVTGQLQGLCSHKATKKELDRQINLNLSKAPPPSARPR